MHDPPHAIAGDALSRIYRNRFETTGIEKRERVWRVLCARFFTGLIGPDQDILEIACGWGEFINNIAARSKTAIDLNPDSRERMAPDVRFHTCHATDMAPIPNASVDVVFTSNFLEHLPSKAACDAVFAEVRRVLRPGGRFIVLGPNIRYAFREYWDFYDHYLPLSHLSLAEGLATAGFTVVTNIPRFLPFTMQSRLPASDVLVALYLRMPLVWRIFGKQFLVVAPTPAAPRG